MGPSLATAPLVSWGSLLIGVAVVSVTLSDPVVRLGDLVRSDGPIVLVAEASQPIALQALLAGVSHADQVSDGSDMLVAAAPPLEGSAEAWAVQPDHDAHVWDHMQITAPQREAALGLDRASRIALQRRLALMGYDPQGVDGVLGPRSREAIARWQRDFGFPATGYLDADLIASIEERSADAFAEWQSEESQRTRIAARDVRAPDLSTSPTGRAECARGEDGRIREKQSFGCDLKGVREGFQRLLSKMGDVSRTDESGLRLTPADR